MTLTTLIRACTVATLAVGSGTTVWADDTNTYPESIRVARAIGIDDAAARSGSITMTEDRVDTIVGVRFWVNNPADGSMKSVDKFDPALFRDLGAAGVLTIATRTNDQEISGVIDITNILGHNDGKQYNLLLAQDHASATSLGLTNPTAMVEGGQLLVMATAPVPEPETYAMLLAGLGMLAGVARRRSRK